MRKTLILILFVLILSAALLGCGKDSHSHCLCGGSLEGHSCTDQGYKPLTTKMFDSATADSSPVYIYNNVFRLREGSYYLSEDIVLNEQILIINDTVDLCLNGKVISGTYSERTGQYSRIFAVSGGTMNLSDCSGSGEGYIQGSYTSGGAAILIQGNKGGAEGDLGTVNLYSGMIKGGKALSAPGGAITVNGGALNLHGGQIIGGDAASFGGAIYVNGGQKLNLYGGLVTAGKDRFGGCIYVEPEAKVSVGGTVQIHDIYLTEGAVLTDLEPQEGFSAKVSMKVPGIFAENIGSDLSVYFTGDVIYDPVGKTLSLASEE